MLNQLLNQMDEYLTNRPFKRHWWSRSWKSYLRIHPPLSKESPLWKRSLDELRSLRLFDLTPEELGRKIEAYWAKPRWRRWFSFFGMKKMDVWHYYQRCLAYQAVRPDHLEQASVVLPSAHTSFFKELALCLYQENAKFETYIEKRFCNPKWVEDHFSEEMNAYTQRLKEIFLTKLHKSLKKRKKEGQGFTLKQQAEQEYQQFEALMLRYYHQRLNYFFSQPLPGNLIPEGATEITQDEKWEDLEKDVLEANLERDRAYRMVVVPGPSQPVSSSSSLPVSRNVHPTEINPLCEATEWIKKQRQCLELLVKEDALQKVEDLLKTSLNKIKAMTELYFDRCETELSEIKGKPKDYDAFLKSFDDLQRQLKSLLQGGMLLFHPDHVISSTSSQAMRDLICHYSQCYIEQNRDYLDKLKNYSLRIKKSFKDPSSADCLDITRRIEKLIKINKDVNQEIEKANNALNEIRAELKRIYAEIDAKIERSDAERKAQIEAFLKKHDAEIDAKIEAILEEHNAARGINSSQFFDSATGRSEANALSSDVNPPASSQSKFFKP